MARPVQGAEVTVVENGRDSDTSLQEARQCAAIVHSDEQGRFEVTAEIASLRDVFVVARKPGLALAWDRAPHNAPSARHVHFHLVLERPGAISGAVVDTANRAIARATVRAVPRTCYLSSLSQSPISMPASWLSTQTDTNGRFRFDSFSEDTSCDFWVASAQHHCTYVFTPHYLNSIGFEVGRSDVGLALPHEHPVRGRVVEVGSGKPVGEVELEISRSRDRISRRDIKDRYLSCRVRADAQGRFLFPGVPEGEHEIRLVHPGQRLAEWAAEPINILVGMQHASKAIRFEVDRGGILEVRIRDAYNGEALKGITVSLAGRLAYTDNMGLARARLLPGESSALISSGFVSNQKYRSWNRWSTREKFAIQRGETVRLEANLEPGSKVQRVVVDPAGKAVAGAAVRIHPLKTGARLISNLGDEIRTHADGRFEFACGDADPDGWYVSARGDGHLAGFAEVKQPDQTARLKLDKGISVKGVITGPQGSPIPVARVTVMSFITGVLSNVSAEVLTDVKGEFCVHGVIPEGSFVQHRMSVDASGYGPKSYAEIELSDRPGSVTELGRITLLPANETVAGVVVDANEMPVAGVHIFMHGDREVTQLSQSTVTDEQGRFKLDHVCLGNIGLQAGSRSDVQGYASTRTEAGCKDIRIVLKPGDSTGRRVRRSVGSVARPEPRYMPLKGKGLSQAEGLEEWIPEKAKDMQVLLLFFDRNQRPSRNTLSKLAAQRALLLQSNVLVVVLHVNGIEQADLDMWLTQREIPFKTQVLGRRFTETYKYLWGVRSLPWMVLMDKTHKVQAEGFALSELEAKMEEIRDKIE